MAKIKHVFGNRIELRIPLNERTVAVTDGDVSSSEASVVPQSVKVRFSKGYGSAHYDVPATITNNWVTMVDNGTIPIGTWSISVVGVYSVSGRPFRFKKNVILEVVDVTEDGGEYANDEVNVLAYYPVVNGRSSAIVIENGKIYLEVGGHFGEDDDPNDGKAMISTGYGAGRVVREDGKIILYI